MTGARLSWRRAAEVTLVAVGGAWLVTAPVVAGIWVGIEAAAGDNAIGYAFVAVVVGVPASTGVYLLGGGLVLRALIRRCGAVLRYWPGVALLAIAGLAGLALTSAALIGDSAAAAGVLDLVGTLVAAVPVLRWLGRAPVDGGEPAAAW